MRTALITGASSGIGLATAQAFLNAGIAVVGVGRSADKLDAMAAQCAGLAAPLATLALDVTESDAPTKAVGLALERFGRLDHLVNNAGMGRPKAVHDTDDALLDQCLDLMLRAPFRLAREALNAFNGPATIVNVASTYALLGGLNGGAYSAAKAGLVGLTQHMACQYGPSGVRSNAVAPGVIPTAMTEGRLELEAVRRLNVEMTPMPEKDWGSAEDVAQAIYFLSSPASAWINGQVLAVDGGWTTTKYLSPEAVNAQRIGHWSAAGNASNASSLPVISRKDLRPALPLRRDIRP